MTPKKSTSRSVAQRVANRARERGLARDDAFTAYVMDRLLHRLGRSPQVGEFILKGGVLVANLIDTPHRFTRDIDFLRRHGPPDPDDIRRRFREIVSASSDDGIEFDAGSVRAVPTNREVDEYDGVKVFVGARVGTHTFDIRVDIGFGDAVEPPAARLALEPFLTGDEHATVLAYGPESVLAEKIETLTSKFPVIRHRLKDLLDVVRMSDELDFDGGLVDSLRATFGRRGAQPAVAVIDQMVAQLKGRRWETDWAAMLKEKAVVESITLPEAVARYERFVRPVFEALVQQRSLAAWKARGPWR